MDGQNKSLFIVLVLTTIISCGEAYWCTRQKSELIPHVVTEIQKCNQSYDASCSFFSWETCTYSELVDCEVRKNITVTRYVVVEECCPGYKLNPVNNITCISTSEPTFKSGLVASKVKKASPVLIGTMSPIGVSSTTGSSVDETTFKSGVTASRAEKASSVLSGTESPINVSPTTGSVDGSATHVHVDDSDDLLFGLSHGAYAGIICSMLFFLCVCVLIMLHVRKRARKAKAKANKSGKDVSMTEIETTQKMLPAPEVC